ncbi:hypothetical protein PPL_10195 [Heterostelium album PN500]|uniref:WD40 repeat-like protein n=1 Tax=Heterostelium pallidum (strain ATCC 26659 / Pp 5 / PN500) TaxID=670386 RepID=D3BQL0_HETP5|nr:hypothetical protein PPL_10195 [Heterostelium album PN500]EFA76430.1 hypothetical protein PPL_10195 [Heterostelium album PN500]|eukprot:XP_020428562.1 hypothetical protein PPL_10195 [Heterostelium album PN500]
MSNRMFGDEVDEEDELTMLVCQWLDERGYKETLASLEHNSGKIYNPDQIKMGSQLNYIYNEHKELQTSAAFAEMAIDDEDQDLNDIGNGNYPKELEEQYFEIHKSNILACRFLNSPNCNIIVTGSTDKTIKVTDFITQKVLYTFSEISHAPFISLDFSPIDPELLLASSVDGSTSLLRINSTTGEGEVVQQFKDHVKYVVRVRWSPNGDRFATCSYDKTLKYYQRDQQDTSKFVLVNSIEFPFSLESLIFTPDSERIITACRESNYIQYVSFADGSIEKFNMNANGDDHVSFSAMEFGISPNKKYLLVSTDRNRLILFKLGTDKQLRNFYGAFNDNFCTTRNTFDVTGQYIYSTSQDNQIYVWDVSTQKVVSKLKQHTSSIRDLSIHPTLNLLASCSFDKSVCIWKA